MTSWGHQRHFPIQVTQFRFSPNSGHIAAPHYLKRWARRRHRRRVDALRGLNRQSPAFAYPEARSSTSGSANGVWLLTSLPIITLRVPARFILPPFDHRQCVHDRAVLAQEGTPPAYSGRRSSSRSSSVMAAILSSGISAGRFGGLKSGVARSCCLAITLQWTRSLMCSSAGSSLLKR